MVTLCITNLSSFSYYSHIILLTTIHSCYGHIVLLTTIHSCHGHIVLLTAIHYSYYGHVIAYLKFTTKTSAGPIVVEDSGSGVNAILPCTLEYDAENTDTGKSTS